MATRKLPPGIDPDDLINRVEASTIARVAEVMGMTADKLRHLVAVARSITGRRYVPVKHPRAIPDAAAVRVKELCEQGMSIMQISGKMRLSHQAIRRLAEKHGIEIPVVNQGPPGPTDADHRRALAEIMANEKREPVWVPAASSMGWAG